MQNQTRAESLAFYFLLAVVVLLPLVFIPSPYLTTDLIKTLVAVIGTLVAFICLALTLKKESRLVLPPQSLTWTGLLILLSVVVSAVTSTHFIKSFIGQGFEVHTASFLILLFIAAYIAYVLAEKKPERTIILYVGTIISFIILGIFHVLRYLVGDKFPDFSVLNTLTSTFFGSWYELGIFSLLVVVIMVTALLFLPLTRRLRAFYWIIILAGLAGAFLINNVRAWIALAVVLILLVLHSSLRRTHDHGTASFFGRIRIAPLVVAIAAIIVILYGARLAEPVQGKLGLRYLEPVLPWSMTLDVISGVVKDSPLFGVGPNRFTNAFNAYKPAALNPTPFWNIEYATGFGRIPSFIVTQGLVGAVAWALFFIFFAVALVRSLRNLPAEHHAKFIIVSAYSGAVFLWLVNLIYTPSHTLLFYTFLLTGLAVGSSVSYGILKGKVWAEHSRFHKLFPSLAILLVVVSVAWGLLYAKKSVALVYLNRGLKLLSIDKNVAGAESAFKTALKIDKSDSYYQALAEIGLIKVAGLTASVPAGGSIPQSLVTQVGNIIAESISAARGAIDYDPTNYYNYVSEARVLELAARLGIKDAYANAVTSYTNAIKLNTFNPALYLSLARLQAQENKPAEAVQAIGAALSIKNNYIDAIYVLSQIEAARGNLNDAIIAAKATTELNPQNPLLFLQLGLLYYNNKEYSQAVTVLTRALELQPDYANARYFLGLSYSRLGQNTKAIEQFVELARTNPENAEVALILTNLRAGRSAFADAKPPVTPTPERRTTLPVRERQR